MKKAFYYNVHRYINSCKGEKDMTLDSIISNYQECKKYSLSADVAEYLQYIDEEPFFVEPMFSDIVIDNRASSLNPKFVLFSAPGATGKTTLARYIAHKFNAIYWDLAKLKLGTNSFVGSILNSVGAQKYSEFINDLNSAKVMLVIDAFDEAEVISGRKMLSSFISDIDNSLEQHTAPTVILLARAETAQFIASYCAENAISIRHYEIGFFNELSAKSFITKSVVGKNGSATPADNDCINSYYDTISRNITQEEKTSFLGYAPVLEAISTHIRTSTNRAKLISTLSTQKDCVSVILNIMEKLLEREQKKVISAFMERCREQHPEFNEWEMIYSDEEQLVRIVWYVLFKDTSYLNYPTGLPSQLVDDYQNLLERFLPQHPFVRSSFDRDSDVLDFTGPAFRDYTLARIIQKEEYAEIAQIYFEEAKSKSHFPSQIFFDCYRAMSDNIVRSNHISYVYDSYRAKATVKERPYLLCSELPGTTTEDTSFVAVFGMTAIKKVTKREDIELDLIVINQEISFEQMVNVSIDVPSLSVKIGKRGTGTRINNSSVVCKKIIWTTQEVSIESFNPDRCLLVSHDALGGEIPTIEIIGGDNIKVSAPNIKDYYRLVQYKYDLEDVSTFDITKFIHAMRCILVEFRTHRKDTLAKTAERIDFVTVGNSEIKQYVLDYMKSAGIIYSAAHLYKIDEAKMQEKGIFFAALARTDVAMLEPAFEDFNRWYMSRN